MDHFAESASTLVLGNAAICVDSLCTTGRAGINFYCSPNPVVQRHQAVTGWLGSLGSGFVWVNTHCIWEMLLVVILQMLQILLN